METSHRKILPKVVATSANHLVSTLPLNRNNEKFTRFCLCLLMFILFI